MRKKTLLSVSLLTAAVTGVAPVTSYAAEVKVVQLQPGGEYQVISGTDDECLQKILDEIDSVISNIADSCTTPGPGASDSDAPETNGPGAGTPDADAPETNEPGECTSDTSTSDTNKPGTGEPDIASPDTGVPGTPGTGGTNTPDVETPDPGTPGNPGAEVPGGQKPEESVPDEAEPSYAEQILTLVNAERARAGLPALELQPDITAAANVRAKEIKQLFSHTRPDGSSFSSVLKEQGIAYRGSGENIAYGQRTPEQVMEGWMNSEGHRANILNEKFKNIGVGYYQDERGVKYWVQLFTY